MYVYFIREPCFIHYYSNILLGGLLFKLESNWKGFTKNTSKQCIYRNPSQTFLLLIYFSSLSFIQY